MSDAKSRPSTTHSVAKSRPSTSVSGVSRHTSPQYDVTRENSAYPASQADKQAEAPPGDYYARKAVMFTGPDGIRNHRKAILDPLFIGDVGSSQTLERTSQIDYLFSAPKGTPFPKAKNASIGGTGWWFQSDAIKATSK